MKQRTEFNIGQLVKAFKLSRSTFLYYDKIGLLNPSGRSEANYRLYTQQDFDRMGQIAIYKEAGLSLKAIATLLTSSSNQSTEVLIQRLNNLNLEISQLRQQQQIILKLIGKDSLLRSAKVMNKSQWVNILKATGMDEKAMRLWHIQFELALPEVHTDFLQSLGIDNLEINLIKEWSKLDIKD